MQPVLGGQCGVGVHVHFFERKAVPPLFDHKQVPRGFAKVTALARVHDDVPVVPRHDVRSLPWYNQVMSDNTTIEWADATWNPTSGCVKISPGCTHCYAETFAERFRGVPGHPYEQGFDLRLVPEKLADPLRWAR